MRSITIAGKTITDDSDAWVIAEVGHNHGGQCRLAEELIVAATDAGADAVKFQVRNNRSLYTDAFYARPYTGDNSYGATYGEHREALELREFDHRRLRNAAMMVGVVYFATPFDHESADMLHSLRVPVFKIASSDIVHHDLLRHVAEFGEPVIISTGAATQKDVDRALDVVWPINQQIVLMQCTASYPAAAENMNLSVLTGFRLRYPELTIGLSSHYSGISDVVAAYALGARVFEKHFTLDRTMKGTDHAFSLEPSGFKKMVSYLRKTRQMMGQPEKRVLDVEQGAIEKMRMSTRWWQEEHGAA